MKRCGGNRACVVALRDRAWHAAAELVVSVVIGYLGFQLFGWVLAVVCGLAGVGAIVWALVRGFRDVGASRVRTSRGRA